MPDVRVKRRQDVAAARSRLSLEELRRRVVEQRVNVRGGPAFPLVNFPSRILASAPTIAFLAEVKRASPSKGDIAPGRPPFILFIFQMFFICEMASRIRIMISEIE